MEITQEIKDLFELARTTFGAPVRTVELTDQNLCTALERAMLSYNQYVLNFIVEANWSNFYGKKVMTNSQLAFAFSTRTLDLSRDYSDYFSHLVGLQQHGTKWELKKDYFKIVPGQQSYVIPAGRSINKVLRFTNSTADAALLATYYGGAYGFGGLGMAQFGGAAAGAFAGTPGLYGMWSPFYATPLVDVALAQVNMSEKNKYLGNDLVYSVTALETGEHIVNLYSTPGGIFDRMGGFGRFHECYCWYTYYDVAPGEEDDCAAANPDVYLSPDQIKLDMKHYWALNDAAKAVVTQIFLANAAETLAFIRGKFSGSINLIGGNASLQMDYNMLMEFARNERSTAVTELKERLQRLSPYEIAKRDADLVESITKIRKGTPLRPKII
jgi:hypothetical protein